MAQLIQLPFDLIEGGAHWVDPNEVELVNLAHAQVFVGMRSGTKLWSAKPTLKAAIIEGTPDHDLLRSWAEKTVDLVNRHRDNTAPLHWSSLRSEAS